MSKVDSIPENRLNEALDAARSSGDLATHFAIGMRAIIDLMVERRRAHETLGESERAAGLAGAIAAAETKALGIEADRDRYRAEAREISARIDKKGAL